MASGCHIGYADRTYPLLQKVLLHDTKSYMRADGLHREYSTDGESHQSLEGGHHLVKEMNSEK